MASAATSLGLSFSLRARRAVGLLAVAVATAATLAGVGTALAPVARADASTGTAGYFTAAAGRAVDTRDAGGPPQAYARQQLALGGSFGIPSSGVTAVALTITAVNPAQFGDIIVQPYGATTPLSSSQLSYTAGVTVSNTALVAVSSDVKVQVSVTSPTNYIIDVQGYFSAGNGVAAPGGFVPNTNGGERVADTRIAGTAVPQHTVGAGTELTVNLAGRAQIPSTATAVYANITVVTHDGVSSYITPYPTGATRPTQSLNYVGGQNTSLGSVVDINSNEQFTIYVGVSGQVPVDIVIDIQGYYDDSDTKGAFTPGGARVYDSTVGGPAPLAPNETREVQVSGLNGVPSASTGIGALALEVTTISTAANTANYLTIWGHDQAEPTGTSNNNVSGATTRSNLSMVIPGATSNTVFVHNVGNAAIDIRLEVEGWYATPANLPAASGGNCAASGQRASSHQIPRSLTDRASMSWNPVNGNLLVREPLMHLTGAGQSIDVGLRYNSLNDTRPTLSAGWTESALTVNPVTNTVTYTGTDGACYVFTKTTTSGATTNYAAPAYVNATLTQADAHTFTVRMNPSGVTNTYKDQDGSGHPLAVWQLVSSVDSTGGNAITYTYDAAKNRLISIAETAASNRKLTFTYADTRNPLQPSKITDVALGRTVTLTYAGPSGAMDTVTDAAGGKLTFGYGGPGANQIVSVADNNTNDGGTGHTTTVGYDSLRRVANWTLAAVTGATTASTWTAAYVSATQTTLTDALHPATTFTLASNDPDKAPAGIGTAVVTITDPLNHATNFKYNAHGDTKETTNALGQVDKGTYTANYLSNSSTAAGSGSGGTVAGASSYLNYPNEASTAKDQNGGAVPACASGTNATALGAYRPCSGTDAQGHTSTFGYDSVSQNVTSVTTSGNAGAGQTMTYQGDSAHTDCAAKNGQMCTSTDSDGGNHKTSYHYNTSGDLTSIDRPAGLGDIVMTYDADGRILTRSDGAGNISYFSYDGNDRPVQVTVNTTSCAFDGTGSCIQYHYDHAGNLDIRGDRTGTTFLHFDAQNRLTEKQVKAPGTTTITVDSYATYDAVGNRTGATELTDDGNQTTTYGYDTANRVAWLAEPGTTSCPTITAAPTATTAGCVLFLYDPANRRTDTYLPNGRDNHVDYDTNGRASYLDNRAYGGNTSPATAGRSYAYTSGPKSNGQNTAGDLVSATGTAANTFNTYYAYDGMNRLTDQGGTNVPTDANATAYWHYDANGNRLRSTTTGTGGTTTFAAYNDANQLCWTGPTGADGTAGTTASTCSAATAGSTTYTWDGAGNMTGSGPTSGTADRTFAYGIYDQMITSVTGGVNLTYGYADSTSDERTQAGNDTIDNGISGVTYVVEGSKWVEYIRDPAGTLIEMRVRSASTTWQTQYYTLDRLGSVILLTSTTGTTTAAPTYDSWGVTTSATPSNAVAVLNRYGYASGYTDSATGLVKFGTRYYNPTLAIWTQSDPAAQGANYYIYAGDSPLTNTDPSGLDSSDVTGSGCAFWICLDVGVTTDDNGDDHFHIGGGVSTDEFGADVSLTDSSDDGEGSGAYAGGSCSAGGYTAGFSDDEGGYSGNGGVDIGTGDLAPSCDVEAGYQF